MLLPMDDNKSVSLRDSNFYNASLPLLSSQLSHFLCAKPTTINLVPPQLPSSSLHHRQKKQTLHYIINAKKAHISCPIPSIPPPHLFLLPSRHRKMSTSPAEKAEARRQKILAKKRARLAYAAGARTELPRAAAAEPVPLCGAAAARAPAGQPAGGGGGAERLLSRGRGVLSRGRGVLSRGRGVLVAACAVAYAVAMRLAADAAWRVSAVHLFAAVEVCAESAAVVRAAGEARTGMAPAMGVVGAVLTAGRYAAVGRRVAADLAVFMLAFLVAWYVCGEV